MFQKCQYDDENDETELTMTFDSEAVKDMDLEDYKIRCLNLERQVEELKRELRRYKNPLDYNVV